MAKRKPAKTPIGTKQHRLTVTAHRHDGYMWFLDCLCDCGKTRLLREYDFIRGQKSCGCYRDEIIAKVGQGGKTHGMSRNGTPEYTTWYSMKYRVSPDSSYDLYRGMEIQPEWKDSFEEFYKDMGPKPKDGQRWTIDRIDGTKGYIRDNVRWATYKTQTVI